MKTASMVMHIAHQPTASRPDTYNGSVTPRPTCLVGTSGISPVPVHSHTTMVPRAKTALTAMAV